MHIRRRRHGVRAGCDAEVRSRAPRSPCPFPDVLRQGAQFALERTWENHPRGRIPADLLRPHRRHADLRRVWSLPSTRALPTTRCCAPCTPKQTSTQLPTACGCSSSSTGAARPPTPTSADTRGCGCATPLSASTRWRATSGCCTCGRPSTRWISPTTSMPSCGTTC